MDTFLIWGPDEVPIGSGTEHFLVAGATGSGKTTLIQMLMGSVLLGRPFDSGRALVYDPKQDIVSRLSHPDLALGQRLRILHPFDTRCCAWDLAQDIDGPLSARQIATILVPKEEGSENNSFFINAVRDLLTGIFLAFINCVPNARSWTLRDIILTMLYEPYLRYVLSLTPPKDAAPLPMLARLRETYLSPEKANGRGADPRTASNIRATINTTLGIYEPVAAAWFEAWNRGGKGKPVHLSERYRLSLKEWVKSNEVLVMGNDETSRAALDPINQAIFKRIAELTLSREELEEATKDAGENQTWFFLDEVREAGELDGLSRLMLKGRSKGACVVLGFQDIDGLRAVYSEEIAHEIVGQCANIAVLRLNSPSTAEWAVQVFGSYLARISTESTSAGTGESSVGSGESPLETSMIYTRRLLTLPLTNPTNGLTGVFKNPDNTAEEEVVPEHLDWQKHISTHLLQKSDELDFKPRPVSDHYLQPWDKEDWDRLGFPGRPIDWASDSGTFHTPTT